MNKVWIELLPPATDAEGHERATLLTKMLERLGVEKSLCRCETVWWCERKQRFAFRTSSAGTFQYAEDRGHWFNLDFLGRPDPEPSACVEPTLPDEALSRG